MSVITSKICIVGDFGVGKTSTVERFVNSQFSDKYLTTIGVKVDTKNVSFQGVDHKLVLWDIAGTNKFGELEYSYLRGASGYLLIVDGTRYETCSSAIELSKQIRERYGDVPHVFLINKSDLRTNWEIKEEHIDALRSQFKNIFFTSAKTGDEVETAVSKLLSLIVDATNA